MISPELSRYMSRLVEVYERLLARFGPQGWWPAETAFEVLMGAILTQRTRWRNAAQAIENLKQAGLMDPAALASASIDEIAGHVRCAGFYRQKAERLVAVARVLVERYDGSIERAFQGADTEELRGRLTSWRGLGPETADSVLLYAAGRLVLPVDLYTVRLMRSLGFGGGRYSELQRQIASQLPADVEVYKEFHALVDELRKAFCRAEPLCRPCPLRDLCSHASTDPSHSPRFR